MSKIIPGFPLLGFWVDETKSKAKKWSGEIFPRPIFLLFLLPNSVSTGAAGPHPAGFLGHLIHRFQPGITLFHFQQPVVHATV